MKQAIVVKFGGSIAVDLKARKKFLDEAAYMAKSHNLVLVHGGGPEIGIWSKKIGLKPKFVEGLRYTDNETLEIVEMVLSGKINKSLVEGLIKRKVKAVGISGKDGKSIICRQDKKLGLVGIPKKTDPYLINLLLKQGYAVVLSPLSLSESGRTLNVNADHAALAVAKALKAKKLIFMTDVEGVLDKNNKTIKKIKTKEVKKLIVSKVISGGMIPKIKSCSDAVKAGVSEVWIACGKKGLKKLTGTVIKG